MGCAVSQGSGDNLGGSAGSSRGGAGGAGRSASGGTGATGTGGSVSATGGSSSGGSSSGGSSSGGSSSGGSSSGGSFGGEGGDSAGGGAGRSGGTGGDGTAGHGATGGAGGAFQAAAHPSLPQVVDLGGSVLTAPKVLPIIYASDSGSGDIKAFLQEYAASATWAEQTSEYGVGPLTVLPAVTINGTAPKTITDATLQAMIGPNTSGTKPGWGQLDAHTIYMFVMPEGTLATESNQTCCTEFDGYHSEAQVGSAVVPYAVVCSCPSDGPGSLTTLQGRTVAMSHELVESATDPYPHSDPAFTQEDDDDIVWTLVTGGEVGDMCEFNDDANVTPDGAKYMIQRTWSNAAAARGQSPCVPVKAATPYLNAFPALDRISDGALGRGFSTLGLSIPIGQKKTIPLTLSSAGPTGATWKVQVFDYDLAVAGTAAGLSLSLDKSSGRNGDTLHLTITPKVADPQIGGEAFMIVSTYGAPGDAGYETQLTMGLVTN